MEEEKHPLNIKNKSSNATMIKKASFDVSDNKSFHDSRVQEDSRTSPIKKWTSLREYRLDKSNSDNKRTLEQIIEMNTVYIDFQILLSKAQRDNANQLKFRHNLKEDSPQPDDVYRYCGKEFLVMNEVMNWISAINNSKFEWEGKDESIKKLTELLESVSIHFHAFDIHLLHHHAVQRMFPVRMIDILLSKFNQHVNTENGALTLKLQTALLEVFLFHHLLPDTRFHNYLIASDLSVMPVIYRISIRERNRAEQNLKDKYFNQIFNLKDFVWKLLDLYFPTISYSYLQEGQDMHRWCLKLVLTMFEMGFYELEDVMKITMGLSTKFENLETIENTMGNISETDPDKEKKKSLLQSLQPLFLECKELSAAIMTHIVVIINDYSYVESLENPLIASWKSAFFNSNDVGKLLFRTFTSYTTKNIHTVPEEQRSNLFSTLNSFIRLIVDTGNDICMVSARMISFNMVEYFELAKVTNRKFEWSDNNAKLEQTLARFLSTTAKGNYVGAVEATNIKHIGKAIEILSDQFASLSTLPEKTSKANLMQDADNRSVNDRRSLQEHVDEEDAFSNKPAQSLLESNAAAMTAPILEMRKKQKIAKQIEMYKYSLCEESIPGMLLCSLVLAIEHRFDITNQVFDAIAKVCEDNLLCQAAITSAEYWPYWKALFAKKPLETFSMMSRMFKDKTLLKLNRYRLRFFLSFFEGATSLTNQFMRSKAGLEADKDDIALASPRRVLIEISNENSIKLYFMFCDFVEDFLNTLEVNASTCRKFYKLTLQEILLSIIKTSVEILTRHKTKYELVGNSTAYLKPLFFSPTARYDKIPFTSEDHHLIVFEVAVKTIQIAVLCTDGLFLHRMYTAVAPKALRKSLIIYDLKEKPDFTDRRAVQLLEINQVGFLGYIALLQLYTNVGIFYLNGMLTCRLSSHRSSHSAWNEDMEGDELNSMEDMYCGMLSTNADEETPVTLIDLIKDVEFLLAHNIDRLLQTAKAANHDAMSSSVDGKPAVDHVKAFGSAYYLDTVLPLIYKCCSGLLSASAYDSRIAQVDMRLKLLIDSISNSIGDISKKFGVVFSVVYNPDNKDQGINARCKDYEDKVYDSLDKARDKLYFLMKSIENAYQDGNIKHVGFPETNHRLVEKYHRNTPLTSTIEKYEPWVETKVDYKKVRPSNIEATRSAFIKRQVHLEDDDELQKADTENAQQTTRQKYKKIKSLMEDYQVSKITILSVSEENVFLRFINDEKNIIDNLTRMFFLIVQRNYGSHMFEAKTEESYERNVDNLVKKFIEDETVLVLTQYFASVQHKSNRLRSAMLDMKNEMTEEVFSALCFLATSLFFLSTYKTFDDVEKKRCFEIYEMIMLFFKNLVETDYSPFKAFFNEFKPHIKGMERLNPQGLTLIRYLYYYMTKPVRFLKSHYTYVRNLNNSDRPEFFPALIWTLRIGTECCIGPYPINQKGIGTYEADSWAKVLKRQLDYPDSSYYNLKSEVLDNILAATEGDNPEAISCSLHYASLLDFEQLMGLIYQSLKTLYIRSKYENRPNEYEKVVSDAYKTKLDKSTDAYSKKRSTADTGSESESSKLGLVNKFWNYEETNDKHLLNSQSTLKDSEVEIVVKNRLVTRTIFDYSNLRVKDYNDITDRFKRKPSFYNHVLLQVALKAYTLLIKFSSIPQLGGYAICLENVYKILINEYGNEVPLHIQNQLKNYHQTVKKTVSANHFQEQYVFMMFLAKITNNIELVDPDGGEKRTIVYLRRPNTFFLTDRVRTRFLSEANTESIIVDLMNTFENIEAEMNESMDVCQKSLGLYLLASEDGLYYATIVLWWIGLIINVFLISSFKGDVETYWTSLENNFAFLVFKILSIIISVVFLLVWVLVRYKLNTLEAWQDVEEEEVREGRRISSVRKFSKVYLLDAIMKDTYPFVYITCCLSSLLGAVEPVFYTLQLLTLVGISKTANYVLKAITLHFNQLALTFALASIVIFGYSVLTATYYWDVLETNQSTADTPAVCTQLWECLLYTMNLGLRMGGGIGDKTIDVDPMIEPSRFVGKFFFDVGFFMLINVVALNIIFGIIIDTFASMREQQVNRGNILSNCRISDRFHVSRVWGEPRHS